MKKKEVKKRKISVTRQMMQHQILKTMKQGFTLRKGKETHILSVRFMQSPIVVLKSTDKAKLVQLMLKNSPALISKYYLLEYWLVEEISEIQAEREYLRTLNVNPFSPMKSAGIDMLIPLVAEVADLLGILYTMKKVLESTPITDRSEDRAVMVGSIKAYFHTSDYLELLKLLSDLVWEVISEENESRKIFAMIRTEKTEAVIDEVYLWLKDVSILK